MLFRSQTPRQLTPVFCFGIGNQCHIGYRLSACCRLDFGGYSLVSLRGISLARSNLSVHTAQSTAFFTYLKRNLPGRLDPRHRRLRSVSPHLQNKERFALMIMRKWIASCAASVLCTSFPLSVRHPDACYFNGKNCRTMIHAMLSI